MKNKTTQQQKTIESHGLTPSLVTPPFTRLPKVSNFSWPYRYFVFTHDLLDGISCALATHACKAWLADNQNDWRDRLNFDTREVEARSCSAWIIVCP